MKQKSDFITFYKFSVTDNKKEIDFARLKTSQKADFAIIRAGLGKYASQKDIKFEKYYSACKQYGIPVGTFWYSYARTVAEAKQEAEACLQVIRGKQFEYPIYFDIEERKTFDTGKENCTALTRAFCETVEKAGYYVGIYASKSHLESYLSQELRQRYDVWVAHYGVSKTSYSGSFGMWQFSESGKVDGIDGGTDLDVCYTDYPSIIQKAGLNGFPQNTTHPLDTSEQVEKSEKQISITLDGKTYTGTVTEQN